MIRMLNKMDKPLLILSLFMFIFGLFMILDASSMRSFLASGSNTAYFSKQLIILIGSFFLFLIILRIPLKRYNSLIYLIVGSIIFMLLFLLISGVATNNSKSWIYIGSFGLQPSEFAKIVIVLFTAFFYNLNVRRLDNIVVACVPLAVGAIFTLLTLLQPDGGTGLILFCITMLLFYASPVSKKIKVQITFLGLSLLVLALLVIVVTGKSPLSKMQQGRFNYLKPCTRYQEDTGYQVCNGYIAINNGKIFSIEPGNSKQKYLYLPEAHTDFIFPIIVEEMGLITGIFIAIIAIFIMSTFVPEVKNVFYRFEEGYAEGNLLNGRNELYDLALKIWKNNPIFGSGWGAFSYIYKLNYHWDNLEYLDVHNVYLQLLCECGVIGLSFFLIIVIFILIKSIKVNKNEKIRNNSTILALGYQIFFLLYCFSGNPLYDNFCYTFYFMSIGIIMNTYYKNKNRFKGEKNGKK